MLNLDSMSGIVNFIGVVEKIEGDLSTILIFPEYAAGLDGLDAYDKLYILYWLHEADNPTRRTTLRVVPRRHGATEERGVFSTHSPHRPNPLGLTTVELVEMEVNRLTVRGLDAFEGSPIVDIKPEEHSKPLEKTVIKPVMGRGPIIKYAASLPRYEAQPDGQDHGITYKSRYRKRSRSLSSGPAPLRDSEE